MKALPTLAANGTNPPPYTGAAGRYVEAGLSGAANKRRAYQSDLKRFAAWCAAHDYPPPPAPPGALASFITSLAEAGKKVATIQQY